MGKKKIIIIHGRDYKPKKKDWQELWEDAIQHGIRRDYTSKLNEYNTVNKEFIYFGGLSKKFLDRAKYLGKKPYKPGPDLKDRKKCLKKLKKYTKADFKNKKKYLSLSGMTPFKEFVADLADGIVSFFGLSKLIIGIKAPDMVAYWEEDTGFGHDSRWGLTKVLRDALKKDEDVLLISHSLGCIITYDVLWKFAYMGEYGEDGFGINDKKLTKWITIGCPLADENVKKYLKGATATGTRKYPNNIKEWVNIAAEDDYVAHDQNVENDFRKMKTAKLIEKLTDERIYNLAVRGGKSNPHHGAGYLIHPNVVKQIVDWL